MERATRQKLAIRTAIDTARRPLMPQEVLEDARLQVPTLSIATVYRNLKALLQDGAIHLVALPGDSPRYESTQAASTHHHHFQCSRCQRVFDVPGCPGELEHMAPKGFTVERHELTFYGVCADCRRAKPSVRPGRAARAPKGPSHPGHRHD